MGIRATLAEAFIRIKADDSDFKRGMSKLRSDTRQNARQIADEFTKAAKIQMPQGAGGAVVQIAKYRELAQLLRSTNQTAAEVNEKIASGARVSARDVDKLIVAEQRLRAQLESTFGSVQAATGGAATAYQRVAQSLANATAEARRQKIAIDDSKGATSQAGIQYLGLNNALTQMAGKYGTVVAKAGVASLVIGELINVSKDIVKIFTGPTEQAMIAQFFDTIIIGAKASVRALSDLSVRPFVGASPSLAGAHFGPLPTNNPRDRRSRIVIPSIEDPEAVNETIKQIMALSTQADIQRAQMAGNRKEVENLTRGLDSLATEELKVSFALKDQLAARLAENRALAESAQAMGFRHQLLDLELQFATAAGRPVADLTDQIDFLTKAELMAGGASESMASRIVAAAQRLRNLLPVQHFNMREMTALLEPQSEWSEYLRRVEAEESFRKAIPKGRLLVDAEALVPKEGVFQKALRQQLIEYSDHVRNMENLTKSMAANMESALTDGFFSLFTGNIKGVEDAFRSFLNSIVRDIANMMAKEIVKRFLAYILQRYSGYFSGLQTSSLAGSASLAPAAPSTSVGSSSSHFGVGGLSYIPSPSAPTSIPGGGAGGRPPLVIHLSTIIAPDETFVPVMAAKMAPLIKTSDREVAAMMVGNFRSNGIVRSVFRSDD